MGKIYEIDGVIPVVHEDAYIHPEAVLIGDVIVGADCYIGPGASLRGDFGRIIIGQGANIQDNCVVHSFPEEDVRVEAGGHVGHGAILHGCHVGVNALIGMNAVVMDHAVIGENSFVAAMAFVKAGMQVPPNTLVAGIPARIVRELSDKETGWKTEGTLAYQHLAVRSRETLCPVRPLRTVEPDRPRVRVSAQDMVTLKKKRGQ